MLRCLGRLFGTQAQEAQGGSADPEIPPGAYVIGRTKDLLKLQHAIAPDDPRRSLFVYLELREEEEKQWAREDLRRVLSSQDPDGPDHLTRQIQQLSEAYSPQEMQDLANIRPSAGDSIVGNLCRDYRIGSEIARSFIRSRIDFKRAWTLFAFSKRAAIFSIRKGEPDLIRDRLIAHAIENLAAEDVRDNMVALG